MASLKYEDNLDEDTINSLIDHFNKVLEQEKAKNRWYKELFENLRININNMQPDVQEALNELAEIQQRLGSTDCKETTLMVDHTTRELKNLNTLELLQKLKLLCHDITKHTSLVKTISDKLQNEYNKNSVKIHKEKADKYKQLTEKNKELLKKYIEQFETIKADFPKWDSTECDVERYQKEIDELNNLRRKHAELTVLCDGYFGASKEYNELLQQLNSLNQEFSPATVGGEID